MRGLWVLFTCVASLAWALPSWAQLNLQLSAERVEVGSTVQVKLTASGSQAPQSPRLDVPAHFSVVGPRVGTSHQVSIVNGRVQRSVGVTATWQLTPTRRGEFTIGPASVVIEGQELRSDRLRLTVVAEGTLPRSPGRRAMPFDDLLPGFGSGRSLFDDLFGTPRWHASPQAPPEYQLERAPDRAAFLRAVAEPRRVVVGQQVTLEVFAYGALGRFNESPGQTREPRTRDFYAVALREPGHRQQLYPVTIDGRDYLAVKMRELALFPLKSGSLTIGPMQMGFYGSRYLTGRGHQGLVRQSNELTIEVSEPPLAGRPAGYRLGDVGDFQLHAEVSDREVQAGGSISVEARVSGSGNFPLELDVPQQHGVEWLQPTIRDAIAPNEAGRIAGSKTFTYVVKLTRPGELDLGQLELSYFHPPTRSYRTASVNLERVSVEPAAPPAATKNSADPPDAVKLSELAAPRAQLVGPTERHYLADGRWFWAALALGPLAVLAGGWFWRLGRHWSLHRRQARQSWQRQAASELAHARASLRRDPNSNVTAYLERALFGAIEGATAIRGRGLLRPQLADALARAGLGAANREETIALLQAFEEARFGAGSAPTTELLKRTQALVRQLDRVTPPANSRREAMA